MTMNEANALHVISGPWPVVVQPVTALQSVPNKHILSGSSISRRHTAIYFGRDIRYYRQRYKTVSRESRTTYQLNCLRQHTRHLTSPVA